MTAGPLRCFVFTDIEGSTQAWESAADEMDVRLRHHDQVLRDAFSRRGGRVFNTTGDGFAVVFDDVANAVDSVVAAQVALVDDPIRVRIGMHVGQAVERDSDFFGPTVNRTARVMSAGHGGQVLLSEAAAALARASLSEGLELVDLGVHSLKGLSRSEHIWQLVSPSTRGPFPPLRADGAVATNLPTIEPLLGRDVEVSRVMDLVRGHRLVTITGPGGVGKSSLAIAVARELEGDASDGTWLVELAPVAEAPSIVAALAGVLPLPSLAATASELVSRIGRRELLVVLDNCEHHVDDVAMLVTQILASCSRVRLLCTSQEALALDREHVWPLQPLAQDAAAALFQERATAVRPDGVDNPDAVALIVEQLDGLPLAIELAATRVSTFSTAEIAAQLDDRFELLSGGLRGRHPRHRALAAMVDWGYELLEPDQQRLFRRLGVFAGSFARDAGVAVSNVESARTTTLANDLDHLVRRSLVVADVGDGETRYRLLETMRHYALDRLDEVGESVLIRRRHAEWYADAALPVDPDEEARLWRGIAEFDNIRVAVGYALATADADLAVRLVGRSWVLAPLCRAELLEWARTVVGLPGSENHPEVGYVFLIIAQMAIYVGAFEESNRAADAARSRPLTDEAWAVAVGAKWDSGGLSGRRDEERSLSAEFADRLDRDQPANRFAAALLSLVREAYSGKPAAVDPTRFIHGADRSGIASRRVQSRGVSALAFHTSGRAAEAKATAQEALEIAERGPNRFLVNSTKEILALVSGAAAEAATGDDLAESAARACELGREYPLGLGYAIIGLATMAERAGRAGDVAVLAGYLAGHLAELGFDERSAERLARGPLERFVTNETAAEFARGEAMSTDDLYVELERLAGSGP